MRSFLTRFNQDVSLRSGKIFPSYPNIFPIKFTCALVSGTGIKFRDLSSRSFLQD
jgi:hypothetical protein